MADVTEEPRRGGTAAIVVGLLTWAALVVFARWRGRAFGTVWKVQSVPLTGHRDVHITVSTLLAVVVGLAAVVWLPGWCARVSWRRLLGGIAALVVVWGLGLALLRGPSSIDRSMANENEYPAVVHRFDAIGSDRFIATFTDPDVLGRYPIHVEGHPLGATLVFVGLERVGLGGASGAVLFLLAASAVSAPAALVAARAVAGEGAARRAAPFLALMPGAIWAVTSADALFAAVGAVAVALIVVATNDRHVPDRHDVVVAGALAFLGGAAFGAGIELTYGLMPLTLVPVAVAVARRRWAVLAWAALGGAVVVGAMGVAGFWWFDGLAATRVRYLAGIASVRPRGYWTFLGNPAAFLLALGPAAVAGLVRLRDRRLALLVVPAVLAVALADLSGLSKAEVERIWLPFTPWVLLATASLWGFGRTSSEQPPSAGRRWLVASPASLLLAAQVLLAIGIESTIRTPW